MTATGYAVVDLETTGVFYRRDRIVEIAVVHVSPEGEITAQWETLVHPERDLGATHIHGLRGAHMRNAPRFAQVADELSELLDNRVLVAHNASFDTRFLANEWQRAGILDAAEFPAQHLCTMQLASRLMPDIGRKLSDCCASLDIELEDAHTASADAVATAKLLAAYIGDRPDRRLWAAALEHPLQRSMLRQLGTRAAIVTRMQAAQAVANEIADVAANADHGEPSIARATEDQPGERDDLLAASERDYLALLDRFLEDHILTLEEAEHLRETASEFGIDSARSNELHRHYFDGVVEAVWRDGVLTGAEKKQLRTFGEILGMPQETVTEACKPRTVITVTALAEDDFELKPGMHVVITGELTVSKEEWGERMAAVGVIHEPALTKSRTDVLIAADIDSLSGKAAKARKYGKPIRDEAWLESALGVLRS